jgi:hypothetical protein
MKYSLFLLAAIVGTVFGKNELGAEIQGFKADSEFCSNDVMDELYELCVEIPALDFGAVLTRRLTLRGDRHLSCSLCPPDPLRGQWCYVKCSSRRRRLTAPDDNVVKGQIQKAANDCFDEKAQEPAYAGVEENFQVIV